MRKKFDEELVNLNKALLEMAGLSQQIIAMAVKSIEEQDLELAEQAISLDEKVEQSAGNIARMCIQIMLMYQPVFADDLRRVTSAMKMITDMARIGNHAVDIAKLNIPCIENHKKYGLEDILKMAKASAEIVSQVIDAYINNDLELARSIEKADDVIDELFFKVKNEVIEQISKDKEKGSDAIDEVMVAKYFEGIGDHAVNIAEWVEFSITAIQKNKKIM